MARGDLFKIIQDIQKELVASRRDEIDSYDHIFNVNGNDLARQIKIQLVEFRLKDREENKVALTPTYRKDKTYDQALLALEDTLAKNAAADDKMAFAVGHEFASRMRKNLIKAGAASKAYNVIEIPGGSEIVYKLRISPTGEAGEQKPWAKKSPKEASINVFDFIRDNAITPDRAYVRNKINTHLGKKLSVSKLEKLFDLGHLTAVSSFKIAKAKQDLLKTMGSYPEVIKALVGIEVLSQFTQIGDPDLTKVFSGNLASVEVQSKSFNNLQSTYEAAALRALNLALETVINDNENWATQGGSDALSTAIAKELMNTAKTRGAKVSISGKQTKAKTKANKKVSIGLRNQTTHIGQSLGQVVPDNVPATQSRVNMQNLIPMLNQKLPDLVKSNMGKNGALHNRTGRFAESVEVASISADGFSVGYTYQTDPYAVFESQGNRDPRRLIDVSIRQAAAGIMNVRFSTGRVR